MFAYAEEKLAKPRILVIDDEFDIRETLDMVLSSEGYEVATAESGDAAVIRAHGGEVFDLAITDLRMPGLCGIETMCALRQLHPKLAVIVMTGYASMESTLRCREEGAFRIVTKPFDLDDLLDIIKVALGEGAA